MKFRPNDKWKRLVAVTLILLLIITGCAKDSDYLSSRDEDIGNTSGQKSMEQEDESGKDNAESRADEVFDTEKYQGQLTAIFFLMESDKKSGDSIFIKTPDGITMLIDAGLRECGSQIVDYLNKLGVKKLDYIVVSHPHQDHIGGFPDVIENFEVDKALVIDLPYDTSHVKRFEEALASYEVEKEFVGEGDTFKFGNHIKVEILNPEAELVVPEGWVPEDSAAFVNNKSMVMRMVYGEKTFLFTGDIYREKEMELIEEMPDLINVDVLKVPHHGADTSSSKKIIEAVSPKYAFITSNHSFDINVYNNYRKVGSDVYITGIDGNILLVCDGKSIDVITEQDRVSDFLK